MANGRTAVGRYLTGGINKVLSYRELAVINEAGLHIIPIYQTTGDHASYFSENKGKRDAYYAYDALVKFKFPGGSTVYFAVDYDATVAEVNSKIIPYFKSIRDTFNNIDMHGYKIGIYAPRYVCTLVREAGYSVSSFVCDMSSGYLCNIGHSLPTDWAFDQIHTINIGSGDGAIEIDNDIASGRDKGCVVDVNADFEQTESDNEAAKLAKIQRIIQAHNLDINAFEFGFNYEQHYTVIDTGLIKISYVISDSAGSNPNATEYIRSEVVNGKFESFGFETEVNNIMASMNLGQYEDNCINLITVATAVNYGMVRIEIEGDVTNMKFSITTWADVYKGDSELGTVEYSVGVTYEIDLKKGLIPKWYTSVQVCPEPTKK